MPIQKKGSRSNNKNQKLSIMKLFQNYFLYSDRSVIQRQPLFNMISHTYHCPSRKNAFHGQEFSNGWTFYYINACLSVFDAKRLKWKLGHFSFWAYILWNFIFKMPPKTSDFHDIWCVMRKVSSSLRFFKHKRYQMMIWCKMITKRNVIPSSP